MPVNTPRRVWQSDAGDWVSFHRNAGQDSVVDGVAKSATGLSELPMRHMFGAWADYMAGRPGE